MKHTKTEETEWIKRPGKKAKKWVSKNRKIKEDNLNYFVS